MIFISVDNKQNTSGHKNQQSVTISESIKCEKNDVLSSSLNFMKSALAIIVTLYITKLQTNHLWPHF